jgi:hypothetical protein
MVAGPIIPDRYVAPVHDDGHFGEPVAEWGIAEYDVARRRLASHHFETVGGVVVHVSMPFRSTWPAELDLMAQLAGMTPRDRWGGWREEPFTSDSRSHVSVWERGD